MTVDEKDLKQILKAFDELQKSIKDPKMRRRVMRKPAKVVQKAAQSFVKDSGRTHHRYEKSYKKGKKVATYYSGNLRKSIKRLPLRRTPDVFVGPQIRRTKFEGEFGLTARKVDGYYAAMSRGKGSTALKFRSQVLEPGLTKSAAAALKAAQQAFSTELTKIKSKTGL